MDMYRDTFGKVNKIWIDEKQVEALKNMEFKDNGVKAFVSGLISEYEKRGEKSARNNEEFADLPYAAAVKIYLPDYLRESVIEELGEELGEIAEQL